MGPIRWGFYTAFPDWTDSTYAPLDDSLGMNMSYNWGGSNIRLGTYGLTKGYVAPGGFYPGDPLDMTAMGKSIMQRIFSPSPGVSDPTRIYYWRYNDLNIAGSGATWHDSRYDTNDISAYAEYPQNSTFVDSIVAQGNEGRVILGYSDLRVADTTGYNSLLYTRHDYPFAHDTNGPKAFSAILEFNLDTSSIITTGSSLPLDSIPLLKFQVLFKQAGQTIKPFTPFKTSSNLTNPGWYALADTTITRAIYRTLDSDWRSPDSLENGSLSHSWKFKQLHIVLKCPMGSYNNLIFGDNNTTGGGWGYASGLGNDTQLTQPDFITEYDSSNAAYIVNSLGPKMTPLVEIRVLSMYRATARVRDVTWQDTTEDKFFYRRRITRDSTHSLNPNGTIGGYDDSLRTYVNYVASLKPDTVQREVLHSDWSPFDGRSTSIIALLDWHLSSRSMATHIHFGDNGDFTEEYRRERMSFDAQPPSLFENQDASYSSDQSGWWSDGDMQHPLDVFPSDYVYYARHVSPTLHWPDSTQDYMVGLIIGRQDTSSTLKAYNQYTLMDDDPEVLRGLRASSYVALHHPKNKKFSIETNVQGWGIILTYAYQDFPSVPFVWHFLHPDSELWGSPPSIYHVWNRYKAKYNQRPTTPEETSVLIYGALANGVTAFSDAQVYDAGTPIGGGPGIFGPDSSAEDTVQPPFVHNYNFGNRRSWWEAHDSWADSLSNHLDGPLPPYYLGYSNAWKAFRRTNNRINQIWDTVDGNSRPAKRFEWLDAYSNQLTHPTGHYMGHNTGFNGPASLIGPSDSISKAAAFLKIVNTSLVKRWSRNSSRGFIDSTVDDTIFYDADTGSFVEVGLFQDSLGPSQKNYATMLVNTRLWPSLRDPDDSGYYNAGFEAAADSIQRCRSTLGDIDVRKVYMKLDLTKTDPTFGNSSYYVVRDLWHPDSTWLLNKDSEFAVYIKPGDAKFLYFEKGIAVNVAAQSGRTVGHSNNPEFCFNNGRRIVQTEGGTQELVTYTREHQLYVSNPSSGFTFAGSPDQSAGDNIMTGYEQPLDTIYSCARPSIAVGMNDTSVALAYWYEDSSENGKIAAAYRKTPGAAWQIVRFDTIYPDTTSDYSLVTPVITPIDDTSWLIAAGKHSSSLPPGAIWGQVLVTPRVGSPYKGPVYALHHDMVRADGSVALAKFQTLASRPVWDTTTFCYNVHMAWQQDTVEGVHQIYFRRYALLPGSFAFTPPEDVSRGLAACDNVHPSLAMGGTYEFSGWLTWSGVKMGMDSFYHDQLAWETQVSYELAYPWFVTGSPNYWPVVRARHEGFSPVAFPGSWGIYSVFKDASSSFHYPQIATEDRRWDYKFAAPSDTSHDWIRMLYQSASSNIRAEVWAPNWFYFTVNENGNEPSLPQAAGDFGPWPDSGAVGRSMVWVPFPNTQSVRITNAFLPRIKRTNSHPAVVLSTGGHIGCDTLVLLAVGTPIIVPPSGPPPIVNWNTPSPSLSGPADPWVNPDQIPNVETTNNFTIEACDSILVPHGTITTGLTRIQDSLHPSGDYAMLRLVLRRAVDSSYYATVDSMIVTRTSIYWPSITPGIDPDTARYHVSCGASTDSVFLSMDAERGDTSNSIERYYVNIMDSLADSPAPKLATHPAAQPGLNSPILVSVHPNPARSTVLICVEDLPDGVPVSATIVNEAGQTVATLYNATPEGEMGLCMRMDCSNLPNGTYYAYIVNAIMGSAVKFEVIK